MKFRNTQFFVFSLAVSICVFAYLLSKVSIREIKDLINNISLDWFVLFVLISIIKSFYRTWRYKLLLYTSGFKTNSLQLFLITLVRNFFSDLLPARLGTLVYIYLVRSRLNIPIAPAVSSFTYSLVFDIISLTLIFFPVLLFSNLNSNFSIFIVIVVAALGMICTVGILILPEIIGKIRSFLEMLKIFSKQWLVRVEIFLKDTEENLLLARSYNIYWKILALSFGVRLCKYLALYVLLIGLVIPIGYQFSDYPFSKVFIGLCSAELSSSLPISGIAGFGAYEGAWALVFQILGYPEKIAIITGISHHIITQLYGYSLGGLALLALLIPFTNISKNIEIFNALENFNFWLKFILSIILFAIIVTLFIPPM